MTSLKEQKRLYKAAEVCISVEGTIMGGVIGLTLAGPVGAVIGAEIVTAAELAALHNFLGRDIIRRQQFETPEKRPGLIDSK
jgi:hypothetical protein